MVRYVRFYTRWHRRENDQFSTFRCTKTGSTQPKLSAACFVVQSCLADADFVVFSNYCLIGTRQTAGEAYFRFRTDSISHLFAFVVPFLFPVCPPRKSHGKLCRGDFAFATEIIRHRQSQSVFLSPEKEKREKRKSCKGCPLDPGLRWRHHNRMWYQREGSVQAAQRGLLNILPRTFSLASPLRAAKQGRGIELVPSGNQDPRLTEPQRDSCQRQLTDEV